ncbi:MAG: hypothetical protein QQW96_03790 [Tychonema bourrellyi B0820]|nr:hypothetical protein [Tychonema bourrellyi B0820]
MYHVSDVKLAFVRWSKAKIEDMTNDIYNVVDRDAFQDHLPVL